MSPNRDQDYFSDGITEEILNGLAQLRTLKVAGRTSSFAFKGRNEDLRDIGAALGVQHVLEGSVRTDGNRLRITAQLVKVSDGFHMWSETYDRELVDVFAVQDEISAAIVRELRGSLLGDVTLGAEPVPIDVANYEKYLEARTLILGRTNQSLLEARALLEKIVAAAPNYAPGLASLAETVVLLQGDMFLSYGDLGAEEVRQTATPLLDRAIEIDPDLANAYAVRGLMLYHDNQWQEAEAALQRAVSLNPSLSNAWNWLSNTAGAQNKVAEAMDYLVEATAIDPLWLVPNSNMVSYYEELGRTDEAWEILERLRPFHQDSAAFHAMDGEVKSNAGALADAHRAYRIAYELSPDTPGISVRHGFNLIALQDFEQAIDVMPPQFSFLRNWVTGQWDEALPQLRATLDADPMNAFLTFAFAQGSTYIGDYEGLVDFYDQHIQSPQTWSSAGFDFLSPEFVLAIQALGRDEDAAELLAACRANLEELDALGYDSPEHDGNWAQYFALSGEYEEAIARLQRSIDRGNRIWFWQYNGELAPVARDPRMIALKKDNLDAINAERAKLGWDPVPEVGIFVAVDPNSN
ncbi:MAG: tetratricopeptide repeat protein [Proteobacteria bacterium]|nr:tetratricopeptide repeat protein [Pseudomonadota bacterium]